MSKFSDEYLSELSPNWKLADFAIETCANYDRQCELSEDPKQPWFSKHGLPTFATIKKQEVDGNYEIACSRGFEGDMHKWSRFVFYSRPKEEGR